MGSPQLKHIFSLGYIIFLRDFKGMSREALLGYFWSFFPVIVISLSFIGAKNSNLLNLKTSLGPYPLFVIIGTILWQTFSESINSPIVGFEKNKKLLNRINFPFEALLLAQFLDVFFNFIIKLVPLGAILIYYRVPITTSILLFPFGIVSLIFLGFMLGAILTPFALIFQDISKGIQVVLPPLMFITPVVYEIPQQGMLANLMKLNPLTAYIEITRNSILGGELIFLHQWIFLVAINVILALFATRLIRAARPIINERLGN